MNKLVIIAAGAVVTAVSSVVVSVYTTVRANRILKKLNNSMCDLEATSESKITDTMLQAAVRKSANTKVDDYLQNVYDDVVSDASKQLKAEAKKAVESCANTIRDDAASKIQDQVNSLDIEELKKRICNQAEKTALRKLDGCLDSTLDKFKKQLEHDRKVYASAYKLAVDDDDVHVVFI